MGVRKGKSMLADETDTNFFCQGQDINGDMKQLHRVSCFFSVFFVFRVVITPSPHSTNPIPAPCPPCMPPSTAITPLSNCRPLSHHGHPGLWIPTIIADTNKGAAVSLSVHSHCLEICKVLGIFWGNYWDAHCVHYPFLHHF